MNFPRRPFRPAVALRAFPTLAVLATLAALTPSVAPAASAQIENPKSKIENSAAKPTVDRFSNPASQISNPPALFARENLLAWCIVPYDGKKRAPAERAAMLARLGFPAVAYDWRKEHVADFEREILAYRAHGLRYAAFWDWHDDAVALFEKHHLAPQFWLSVPNIPAVPPAPATSAGTASSSTTTPAPAASSATAPTPLTEPERIRLAAEKLLPRVRRAAALGSTIGLYNHGDWAGEPTTMVAVLRELRDRHGATNVGLVYNFHHAHDHVDRLAAHLALMLPHLLCVNLNGMTRDGERLGQKLLVLGQGELDLPLLRTLRDSGYRGPIGLIGHTQDDAEDRLRDNLDGLAWLVPQLDGAPPGPPPLPRTGRRPARP
ncbi:MAG: hypothetical protein RLZZ15_1370 [Verrucomicrobiota bacterium]|jgi:hydroxypyruvate isomerase